MSGAPLRVEHEVVVDCSVQHAFELWTTRLSSWWPIATHSFGKDASVVVRIEPKVGGRLLEESKDGNTRAWGEVVEWDPPHRFRHTWHLGFAPDEATDVEVCFDAVGDRQTRVTVTQTGFERLGDQAERRRDGNERGWAAVMSHFAAGATDPA